jgi:hypothetical protein
MVSQYISFYDKDGKTVSENWLNLENNLNIIIIKYLFIYVIIIL